MVHNSVVLLLLDQLSGRHMLSNMLSPLLKLAVLDELLVEVTIKLVVLFLLI